MPGLGRHEGHEALRAAYDRWKPRKPQRHLIANMLVTEWDDHEARVTSDVVFLLQTERGWAVGVVGRYEDVLHLDGDTWRFHSRVATFVTRGWRRMRFGLDVAQQRVSWDALVQRVRFAEDLGFDGAWGFDHFQPMFGDGPGETFEGMSTLAALSGLTTDIRLGLLVTGATYRHPSVLAAQALTIDHASHGRLELALGAAWFEKEHEELGIPFPATAQRFDLLEDTLEIVTRLFSGEVVSYEGKQISLRAAQLLPRPVQLPHPPIWIGGTGPRRTLPLAARYADVWHAFGTPNSLREAGAALGSAGRRGGSGSLRHPAGRFALARRPRGGPAPYSQVARCRVRLPGLRMAGRRRGPDRGVRAGRAPGIQRLSPVVRVWQVGQDTTEENRR